LPYTKHPYKPGTRAIHRSIGLALPVDEAYRLISTLDGLSKWFCDTCKPFVDGFKAQWDLKGYIIDSDILIVRSEAPAGGGPGLFEFRWESANPGFDTIATFELHPDSTGTRLVFLETGFGEGQDWDSGITDESTGWDDCFGNLSAVAGKVEVDPILIERTLSADPAKVWKAWTDPKRRAAWFGHTTAASVKLGGHWNMDEEASPGWIEGLEPGTLLSFSWRLYGAPLHPTLVTVELAPQGESTQLKLTHGGWGRGGAWDAEREGHAAGWGAQLDRLEESLQGR
jgi:uncharacterized protein YndB with AHSA1/START domain